MKILLASCFAFFLSPDLNAQSNNPFNQAGKDFVKSCQVLISEISNGGIKAADESTIKKIQSLIPSKTQMDPSLAGEVVRYVKQDPLPFSSSLKNSSLKPEVQREISLMLEHSLSSDDSKHRNWLTEKTEDLLKSSFQKEDKELLLHLVAIQYNQGELNNFGRVRCNTGVNGRVVSQGEGMDCAAAAALVGFTIGYTVCGFYCGIGGAVIGFAAVVIGEIS